MVVELGGTRCCRRRETFGECRIVDQPRDRTSERRCIAERRKKSICPIRDNFRRPAGAAGNDGCQAGWGTVMSARSGETEDVCITHLAVGWNAGQLKVGSFARSERMAKWNEGLRIERDGQGLSGFAGMGGLPVVVPAAKTGI